jgi:hypothetical protein
MPGRAPFHIGGLLFMYSSIMAGLFLLYSIIWKKVKVKESSVIILFNFVTIVILLFDYFMRYPFTHLFVTVVMLLVAAAISLKKSKKHPFFIAYLLILLIWILNLISTEIPKQMFQLRLLINLVSASLYFIILWRVLKNEKKRKT